MQLIIGGRQTGKTTHLVNIAQRNNSTILCPTKYMVEHIKREHRYDLVRTYPKQHPLDNHLRGCISFMIDDAETFIQHMIGPTRVKACSINQESIINILQPRQYSDMMIEKIRTDKLETISDFVNETTSIESLKQMLNLISELIRIKGGS
jgi:hypothetical protein